MNHKKLFILGLIVVSLVSFVYQALPTHGQDGGDKKPLVEEITPNSDPNFTGGVQPLTPPVNELMGNVLFDQTANVNFFSAIASQIFPDKSNQYYEGADEFTVPGGWTIGAMEALSYQVGYTDAITSIQVTFYNDASGPGTVACSQNATSFTTSSTNIIAEFSSPCTLSAGTYWASFMVIQPEIGGGQWFWARKNVVGSPFYFRSDIPNGSCSTWTAYDICRPNGYNYGLAFRLYEWSDVVVPTPTVPTPTTNIITVTSTEDELITDGDCALREAIFAANYDNGFDECSPSIYKATDIIVLANGATYTLTQVGQNDDNNLYGDLDIWDNAADIDIILKVAGNGTATIDGNHADRILHVLPYARVEVNGITFTHGQADNQGGAIWNQSYLELNNSIVTNNSISASMSYGGGIYNSSMLFIQNNSKVKNNTARYGGGVYNDTTSGNSLTLKNSTISNNTALNDGGGIYNGSLYILEGSVLNGNSAINGGGIYNDTFSTQLMGALMINNVANGGNGGAIYTGSYLTVNQSRLVNNVTTGAGAAIYKYTGNSTVTQVYNSCVVGNTAYAGNVIENLTGLVQEYYGNWWGAANGPSGMGTGSGDSISANIDYSSFVTTPLFDCANSPVATATPLPSATPSLTPSPTSSTCVLSVTPPSLFNPVHRHRMTDTTPVFAWASISGAQSYRLMVYTEDRSFEFKKRVFVANYTLETPLSVGKYMWRVRTQDQTCSTWTGWSQRNTLFID